MADLTRREILRLLGAGGGAAAAGLAAGSFLMRNGGAGGQARPRAAGASTRSGALPNNRFPEVTPSAREAMAMFDDGKGFNCAQAVLSCVGKSYGLGRETACRMGSAFVGGMGMMGLTCGAVTGAFMAIGLKHAQLEKANQAPSGEANRVVREFARRFTELYGSICCNELMGHDISTSEGLRNIVRDGSFSSRCPLYVRDCTALAEELLASPSTPLARNNTDAD